MAEERTQRGKLKLSAFVRTVGDAEMEECKNHVLRDGDPMASSRDGEGGKGNRKKVYSGPKGNEPVFDSVGVLLGRNRLGERI